MKDGLGRIRTLVVLGGDSDIAIATAEALTRRGANRVLLAGRDLDRLEARAGSLRASGKVAVEVAQFDADASETHAAFFDDVFSRFGQVDVVLVAFGMLGSQAATENDPDAALKVVHTNTLGGASAVLHAGERLRRQGQGTLVVLSSVAGQRPRRSNYIYGASKAGLDALSEGLAFALRDQGVQVLTVRPGFVASKMTTGLKAPPFSTTPDKVATTIVRAIARGDELVWSPSMLRYIMMAMKLAPREVFRRLKF